MLRDARARKVVVNDVGVSLDGRGTDDDPAAQVCKEIEALGGEGGAELRLRQRLRRRARNIVQTAVDAFGTVDILVNNAGIVRDKTLLKMDEADFDAVDRACTSRARSTARGTRPR